MGYKYILLNEPGILISDDAQSGYNKRRETTPLAIPLGRFFSHRYGVFHPIRLSFSMYLALLNGRRHFMQ